jgi:hypothetical protein
VSNLVLSFERATTDDSTPEARGLYDLLVGGSVSQTPGTLEVSSVLPPSTEVEDVQDIVDVGAADLAASALTTCSMECPSHDASVYAAVLVLSATPKWSTTTGGVVPELAVPEVTDKALDIAVMGGTQPVAAICLPGLPDHNTPSFNAPPEYSPTTVSTEIMDLLEGGGNFILPPPWLPPGYVIRCKDVIQALQLEGFILGNAQLMLWAAKNPWPPPFSNMSKGIQNILELDCPDVPFLSRTTHLHVESVDRTRNKIGIELCRFRSLSAELLVFCFASCSIRNLHSTLDKLQLSGDCQALETIALAWYAVILVIIFVPGVQSVQLQSTMFRWSVPSGYDTHLLIASTSVDRLLDMRVLYTLWTWCYIYHLHLSPVVLLWLSHVGKCLFHP